MVSIKLFKLHEKTHTHLAKQAFGYSRRGV